MGTIIFGLIFIAVLGGIIVVAVLPDDPENYKKCQHCKKSVKIESVVCKYCRKQLVELPY